MAERLSEQDAMYLRFTAFGAAQAAEFLRDFGPQPTQEQLALLLTHVYAQGFAAGVADCADIFARVGAANA